MRVCFQALLHLANGSPLMQHKLPLQHQSLIRASALAIRYLNPQVVHRLSMPSDPHQMAEEFWNQSGSLASCSTACRQVD